MKWFRKKFLKRRAAGGNLSKKERTEIKDELIFDLLPKALYLFTQIYAYIDPKGGWLIVDAASAKSAEDLPQFVT